MFIGMTHPIRRPAPGLLAAALLLAIAAPAPAQARDAAVRQFVRANQGPLLGELVALLRLPNPATDRVAIRRNAAAIRDMMAARGLSPRFLEDADSATPPAIYGEWRVPGATRTLVFYAHYDGQPAAGGWRTDPWTPTLLTGPAEDGGKPVDLEAAIRSGRLVDEWRVYARSASDDKAGVMAILGAVDALKSAGARPTSNLRFYFEGEEEAGSPHLARMLDRHRALLEGADAWIMVDGPRHPSGSRQVVFGVRGDVNVDITVYGATRPLHSGHYGNWAPNPAMLLAQLLASMKDASGRVRIEGWYDDVVPLGPEELRAIAEAPAPDSALRAELGLGGDFTSETGFRIPGGRRAASLAESINLPSLNVNGMRSGDVGAAARNVIPTTASAVLDLRLVQGNDVRRQVDRLVQHVRAQGFHVLEREPAPSERARFFPIATVTVRPGGYDAERTAMDHPAARRVVAALQRMDPAPLVRVPTLGGSLPLITFREVLGATTLTVPVANHDNNQHAENENLRLGNLWEGIASMAAIMTAGPPD
jgi:acetylornithine deacetylase/succinyl-diaminopimelate desuccinylase-like protein